MATANVTLDKGLVIGDTHHTEAVLREITARDLIEAAEESEKVVLTPDGYDLVASPALVATNTLRRQIVRIGEHKGPLTLEELKRFSATDLSLLQEEAKKLDAMAMKEIAKRGRDVAGDA